MQILKFGFLYHVDFTVGLAHACSKTSLCDESNGFHPNIFYDILFKFRYSVICNFASYSDGGHL